MEFGYDRMKSVFPLEQTMLSRRQFTFSAAASVAAASLYGVARSAHAASSPTQGALVIDAMGEIREVYTDELCREMIDSGLNSVTVTLSDPKSYEAEAYDWAMAGVLEYNRLIEKESEFWLKATSVDDIQTARDQGRIALFYLFQNSTQFARNTDNVDVFYDLGVRSSQITYNYQNWAGAGCKETSGSGLTVFGHELVEKMNDVGMLIDLSHANMRTMADTIAASMQPVIVSHSCCKALFDGVTQMRGFMTNEIENMVHVYYEHIEHAINVAGIEHVCIGSDRDHRRLTLTEEYLEELEREEGENFVRSDWPLYFEELNGPRRMETLWDGLAKRGISDDKLEKLFGLNVHRLYTEVIG